MIDRFEQFTVLIKTIHHNIQKIERQELTKFGYKGSYAQYLLVLHRNPEGIPMNELCQESGLDKAAVSRAVSEMIEHGLIERNGGPNTTRGSLLTLTATGIELTEHVLKCIRRAMGKILLSIEEEDRIRLLPTLEMISVSLNNISL